MHMRQLAGARHDISGSLSRYATPWQPPPAPPVFSQKPAASFVMHKMAKVFFLCLVQSVFLARVHSTSLSIDAAVEKVLRATFKDLDVNKDGQWNQEELEQDLRRIDANGDGEVTWKEWDDSMHNQPGGFSDLGHSIITEDCMKMAFQCGVGSVGAAPVTFQWSRNRWLNSDGNSDLSADEFVTFFKRVFVYVIQGHNDCIWMNEK